MTAELILPLRLAAILAFLVNFSTALPAEPANVIPDPVTEAVPLLQADYADFKSLHYKEGDSLGDLIARSSGQIGLGAPGGDPEVPPMITTVLPDGVIYWRLVSFGPEKGWGEVAAAMKTEPAGGISGAILDLRSNLAADDYAGADQVLAILNLNDDALVKFRPGVSGAGTQDKAPSDHPFDAPIIVLINERTTGAAEMLAAILQADGALVLGRPSAGKAAVFDSRRLSTGQILRYAVAPLALAGGHPLWGHPVTPDINVAVDERAEKGALMLIRDNHILDVIQESPQRLLMSEASLVHGDDPEWDAYLAALEKKPDEHFLLSLPPIRDVALIAALDSLKAIRLASRAASSSPRTAAASQVSPAVE